MSRNPLGLQRVTGVSFGRYVRRERCPLLSSTMARSKNLRRLAQIAAWVVPGMQRATRISCARHNILKNMDARACVAEGMRRFPRSEITTLALQANGPFVEIVKTEALRASGFVQISVRGRCIGGAMECRKFAIVCLRRRDVRWRHRTKIGKEKVPRAGSKRDFAEVV